MTTAKLFKNGQSQAIRLPKKYRFEEDEVGITRMGALLVIYPKNRREEIFLSSLGNFTDDVFESIENARRETVPNALRVSFDTPEDEE